MAKVGGPSLPPVSPNRPPAEPTPVQQQAPAQAAQQAAQQQPSQAARPQASPPPNAPPSAQQVAQQFGSAFVSAGKLASQLVKGLAQTTFVPRRDDAEKVKEKALPGQKEGVEGQQNTRRQDVVEGKQDQGQGQGGGGQKGEAAPQNALGAAFAALRKSKLFRSKKKEKKQAAGDVRGKLLEELQTDYDEEQREQHLVRRWLKGDEEETAYDQAGRASQFIGELERRNEPPGKIARHLASELAGSRDPEFRRNLAEAVQPHLEAMAARVPEAPSEERRTVAALLSRAAHRSGQRGLKAFTAVLSSTGKAEAKELAALAEDSRAFLEGFDQALRRGANVAYRDALAAGATAEVKEVVVRAAADPVDPGPILEALLTAAGWISFEGTRPLAAAVAEAVAWVDDPPSSQRLVKALVRAVSEVPEGAALAVQTLAALWQAGQGAVAEGGAAELASLLQQARRAFQPRYAALVQYRAEVAKRIGGSGGAPTDEEREKHDALVAEADGAAQLAAALFPPSAHVILQRHPANAPGAQQIGVGALGLVASGDALLSLGPGQALLRRSLVAQELGEKTVLDTLVQAARVLASPGVAPLLAEAELKPAEYAGNGRQFLSRIGVSLGQALGAVVSARARKGDLPGAMSLLKSAVRSNNALFGVNPEGARFLSELLEAILQTPSTRAVERSIPRLEKILRQHTAFDLPLPAKLLRPLMNVLAAPRDPSAGLNLAPKPEEAAPRSLELNVLNVEAGQAALAKVRAAQSAAEEPAQDLRRSGVRPGVGGRNGSEAGSRERVAAPAGGELRRSGVRPAGGSEAGARPRVAGPGGSEAGARERVAAPSDLRRSGVRPAAGSEAGARPRVTAPAREEDPGLSELRRSGARSVPADEASPREQVAGELRRSGVRPAVGSEAGGRARVPPAGGELRRSGVRPAGGSEAADRSRVAAPAGSEAGGRQRVNASQDVEGDSGDRPAIPRPAR